MAALKAVLLARGVVRLQPEPQILILQQPPPMWHRGQGCRSPTLWDSIGHVIESHRRPQLIATESLSESALTHLSSEDRKR